MKIGFTNFNALQRTNFKGLFPVADKNNQVHWINTDHFVKCTKEAKSDAPKIYLSNGDVVYTNPATCDTDKILKNYSAAAVSKYVVVDENGQDKFVKGFPQSVKH